MSSAMPPASCPTDSRSFQEDRQRCPHGRAVHLLVYINSSVRMAPAMAARFTDRLWDIGDIVKLIEEREAQT